MKELGEADVVDIMEYFKDLDDPRSSVNRKVTVHGFYTNQRPHVRGVQSGTAVAITKFVRTAWRDVAMTTLLSDPAPVRTPIGRSFLPRDGFPTHSRSPPEFISGGSPTRQLPATPLEILPREARAPLTAEA